MYNCLIYRLPHILEGKSDCSLASLKARFLLRNRPFFVRWGEKAVLTLLRLHGLRGSERLFSCACIANVPEAGEYNT